MKMLSFDFERLSARLFVIAHVVYLSGPRVYNTGRNNQICVVSKLYQLVPRSHCFEITSVDEIRHRSDA
jgi:hypothetical protein